MDRIETAKKILEYWYLVELLTQDKYPSFSDEKLKKKDHLGAIESGKNGKDSFRDYIPLYASAESMYDTPVLQIITNEANQCKMEKWGNITLYFGKIDREYCINKLSEKLGNDEDERPENSLDKIALACLQLDEDGKYIEGSLSLSSIVWAVKVVCSAKTGSFSSLLNGRSYLEDIEKLEKSLTGDNESSITIGKLVEFNKALIKQYVNPIIKDESSDVFEDSYDVSLRLYKNETIKNKGDEDEYSGLSRGYYVNDLSFVSGMINNSNSMNRIIDYSIALCNENDLNRIDVLNRDDFIREILSVQNAPIGKWPSRFMPAVMQQIAINLFVNRGMNGLFSVNGDVFSVNGPPGTGKTTMLKEIVVNNVVERAILLSEYESPDDAFEKKDFKYGEKEEHSYTKFYRHWYQLKNDRINDYGIVVASSNNAAVENVTKELPRRITGDLNALKEDSDEIKEGLMDIQALFDPQRSPLIEQPKNGDPYGEIFFTKYACNLLDDDSAWGLIAAPLGKGENLRKFYKQVLNPLHWDFYPKKESASNRLSAYKKARDDFASQLKITRDCAEELQKIEKMSRDKSITELKKRSLHQTVDELSKRYDQICNDLTSDVTLLNEKKDEYKKRILEYGSSISKLNEKLNKKEGELGKEREAIKDALSSELSTKKSIGLFSKLTKNEKYESAQKLADEYSRDADIHKLRESELMSDIQKLQEEIEHIQNDMNKVDIECNKVDMLILSKQNAVKDLEKEIQDKTAQIDVVENDLKKLNERIYQTKCQNDGSDPIVFANDEYINKMISDDVVCSTEAHVENPWFNQKYNREREKLFAAALRLNKEFVVSSRCCRDNLLLLARYWGCEKGDDNERIVFNDKDKEGFVEAIFQTLFLLVPVVSSTFASIGNMFKDIKIPSCFGTLIVDEAGQAQPQMAVGALYRCRKAIIVGDPKQIEPVVTDDTQLIKKCFNDEILIKYRDKGLSVQALADRLNPFGTLFENGTDYPEWVGCPLVVHRRCVSPMFDISNQISYSGIMKKQTKEANSDKENSFMGDKSEWINIIGKEDGKSKPYTRHFVKKQGDKVCELLEKAFSKSSSPDFYIISPFTTVVNGVREYLKEYCKSNPDTPIDLAYVMDSEKKRIGTVHTFQGKEADEVIFLLGCDSSDQARGAIRWVNNSIVNVAATRAKYRLYIIGDESAWNNSDCVSKAKMIMDTYAIKEIKSINGSDLAETEKKQALYKASLGLPSATHFFSSDETDGLDCEIDTKKLVEGLDEDFIRTDLSDDQLKVFGFSSYDDLNRFEEGIRINLVLGMKLFFLLAPIYKINNQLDASCCSVLFCKAIELQMKQCFMDNLKQQFPEFKMRGMGKDRSEILLKDARKKEMTLGAIETIIKNKTVELGRLMQMSSNEDDRKYDVDWWDSFSSRIHKCTDNRNKCCHSGLFTWKQQENLLKNLFWLDKDTNVDGLMFSSKVGEMIQVDKNV